MTRFLLKKFTKKDDRNSVIFLSGVLGIFFNVVLFIIKIFAGIVMGSVAVISDAINSFSDIGSSVVTVASSKVSVAKPDKEHPFGHGRMEYILTLLVAFIILLAGTELFKESVKKIINPEPIDFSWAIIVLLSSSILIKLYMFVYTRAFAIKANSDLLMASAKDYLSDLFSTTAVILSALVYNYFSLNIDGWAGAIVSLLVMLTGIKALIDGVKRLLGTVPPNEVFNEVEQIILSGSGIMGVHDIVLHDYGVDKFIGTAHAEVLSDADIIVVHDELDRIEREIYSKLGISMVMHVDPVVCDDEETHKARAVLDEIVLENCTDEICLSYHDFRIRKCSSSGKVQLIFDLVVPYNISENEQNEIVKKITSSLKAVDKRYDALIDIDNE